MKIIFPKADDHRIVVDKVLKVSDNLDREFRRQARLYGRVSRYSAVSKKRVRILKNQMEVVVAKLRKRIAGRIEGRMFKDEVQALLVRRKLYQRKWRELNDAIYYDDILSGILRALEHKKDALTQLGANARHEIPDELRMLSKELKRKSRSRDEEAN